MKLCTELIQSCVSVNKSGSFSEYFLCPLGKAHLWLQRTWGEGRSKIYMLNRGPELGLPHKKVPVAQLSICSPCETDWTCNPWLCVCAWLICSSSLESAVPVFPSLFHSHCIPICQKNVVTQNSHCDRRKVHIHTENQARGFTVGHGSFIRTQQEVPLREDKELLGSSPWSLILSDIFV